MLPNEKTLIRLIPLTVAAPSLADNTGDLDRLQRALARAWPEAVAGCHIPFRRWSALAAAFRAAGCQGVAVVNELPRSLGSDEPAAAKDAAPPEEGAWLELVDFLPELPAVLPGLALDLGTTHLEAVLLDLLSGRELARAQRPNSQAVHGADVLTRIHFAVGRSGEATPGGEPGVETEAESGRPEFAAGGVPGASGGAELPGLFRLQRAVVADINALAGELATAAGLVAGEIRALSVAGNTVMGHLLLGLDPRGLCREPYIPVVNAPGPVAAAELGLNLHPAAPVHVLPGVGSYFGGDLLAGIVACDLDLASQPVMLIDVGTNAEVVVGCRDWLVACAGAAGPALEGGVARMGMRAGPGVIERVRIDPVSRALSFKVIGEHGPLPAQGICGSGMIDLMAEMFQAGLLDIRGKFRPERMGDRLVAGPDGPAFMVARPEEAEGGRPVVVSQIDFDALIRSKAAMYAILGTLMEQVGLAFSDLAGIYVAGAFGRHIDPVRAVGLGMIPDLPLATYQPVGNSSLAGACRYLKEATVRRRIRAVARKITYLELNVNHEFMIRFSGSRFIPHTDRSLFPSVKIPD